MTEEELQMRRERHDLEMERIRADINLAARETRFPATVVAAVVIALVGPALIAQISALITQ